MLSINSCSHSKMLTVSGLIGVCLLFSYIIYLPKYSGYNSKVGICRVNATSSRKEGDLFFVYGDVCFENICHEMKLTRQFENGDRFGECCPSWGRPNSQEQLDVCALVYNKKCFFDGEAIRYSWFNSVKFLHFTILMLVIALIYTVALCLLSCKSIDKRKD